MDLLVLVLVLVLIGFVVWLLTTKIPLPAGWATAIQVIALVVLLLYLLAHLHVPNLLPR